MIKAIRNKYVTYTYGEFLPIYVEGKIANLKEFHMYKLKKLALAVDRVFQAALDRAYSK